MDDQVIRVKRANDCPALLKSFLWKAARRRESATERTGGGSSMGSRVDEVFIMAPLPGTAISVFIHTQRQRRGFSSLARGAAQEQLDSFRSSTLGVAQRGFIQGLTICSTARLSSNLTARKNGSVSCWRGHKIDITFVEFIRNPTIKRLVLFAVFIRSYFQFRSDTNLTKFSMMTFTRIVNTNCKRNTR